MGYKTVNLDFPVKRIIQKDNDGCAVASTAMEVNYLNGTSYSYEAMKNLNRNSTTMDWAYIASKCNLNYNRDPLSGDSNFDTLKINLFSKLYYSRIPVIVRVQGSSGQHYVVVNGFQGTLPFYLNDDGTELPSVLGATTNMFKIVDPGFSDHYTLADVIAHYNGDLKALYVYTKK
jgi:hypothetical protein